MNTATKTSKKLDPAPWLLLPCLVLAFSSISVLALHPPVHAAPPLTQPAPQAAVAYDDGDGDELLEHWSDPQFSHEEQLQMAGMGVGFLLLGGVTLCRRSRPKTRCEVVEMPSESDFLKLDSRPETRKAA